MSAPISLFAIPSLRVLRTRVGATKAELASWAGVSTNTISKMEKGEGCREDVVSKVFIILNHPNLYDGKLRAENFITQVSGPNSKFFLKSFSLFTSSDLSGIDDVIEEEDEDIPIFDVD